MRHHSCRRELHKTQKNRNHTNHTPTTTQKVTAASMRFNARVHYTVLTQHPTQANNHNTLTMTAESRAGYNQGIMPQTPNNAPSTSKTNALVNKPLITTG